MPGNSLNIMDMLSEVIVSICMMPDGDAYQAMLRIERMGLRNPAQYVYPVILP